MAVSAVMPRLPLTIVFTRWIGTPIRDESSTCVTPRGFRNSSSSISPGAVGGRLVGSMAVLTSVVIDDLNGSRIAALEAEHDPVLINDPADTYNKEPPKSPLAKACYYAIARWEGLKRFLEDGRLPLDNTASERALRQVAVGR